MVTLEKKVNNLIEIKDGLVVVKELLEQIKKGENVLVSICHNGKGKKLMWDEKEVFVFDFCTYSNEQWNAISVLRDVLNQIDTTKIWTRPRLEKLVLFEFKTSNNRPSVEEEKVEMIKN